MAGIEDLDPVARKRHDMGKRLDEAPPEIWAEAQKLFHKLDPKLRIPEVEFREQFDAQQKVNQELREQNAAIKAENETWRRHQEENEKAREAGIPRADIKKFEDEGMTFEHALRMAQLSRQTAEPTAADSVAGGRRYAGRFDVLPPDFRKMTPHQQINTSVQKAHEMLEEFNRTGRVHQ